MRACRGWALLSSVVVAACSAASPSDKPATTADAGSSAQVSTTQIPAQPDVFDVPIDGLTADEQTSFAVGDRLFDLTLRDADGLGPVYSRTSCGSCHDSGIRGPGGIQKMVVVLADGVTPSPDQSALPYGFTVRPFVTAGATTPITPPPDTTAKTLVTSRIGPTILGRGYVEAILDSEIERVAAEQASRTDAIHGRVNHLAYASEAQSPYSMHQKGDIVIGRFGYKARVPSLDDFTADALQGDMGITSPYRPTEIANPDGLTDDVKPGIDVEASSVENRAMYVRLTAIPPRTLTDAGKALFDQVKCSACHVPSMKTRADYGIAVLAGIDAPIYSDLLLHDMGDALADGTTEGMAGPRDWRTPPLIGLRRAKGFLHDNRATSVEDAITLHGSNDSEAAESVQLFSSLSDADKKVLLTFVEAL